MAREWWLNSSGDCLLKGVEDDPTNPIRLGDAYILDFLRRYQEARNSYNRLWAVLTTGEQERLAPLAKQAQDYVYVMEHTLEDAIQNQANTVGIHTCGPMGGRRMQRMC